MTFTEAYKSGKRFRRIGDLDWISSNEYDSRELLCIDDVLYPDWEVEPEKKVSRCWVNFYEDGCSNSFSNKGAADSLAEYRKLNGGCKRIGNAVEVTLEVKE